MVPPMLSSSLFPMVCNKEARPFCSKSDILHSRTAVGDQTDPKDINPNQPFAPAAKVYPQSPSPTILSNLVNSSSTANTASQDFIIPF